MLRVAAVLLAAPLLLLSACSSPPEAEPAAASRAPEPTPIERAIASPADPSCTDPKGDGDGFDIRSVDVARVGSLQRVTVRVSKLPKVAGGGTASIILSFFDSTGNNGGQFGTKWIGAERAIYVFDLNDSTNAYVDDMTTVSGKVVEMSYPADLVDRAGEGWIWQAVTTLDGVDIDTCSNAAWDAATA